MTQEEFLAQIEAFLSRTGMNQTEFGRAATQTTDGMFVPKLRRGRVPRLDVVSRVTSFMEAYDKAEAAQ